MKLIKNIYDKFSIFLTLMLIGIALPAIAVAQGNTLFAGDNGIRFADSGENLIAQSISAADSANGHSGGINVLMGDGSVRFLAAVSRIHLPNSPLEFDSVDANDTNAAVKTRMLIDAADRLRRGIVITVLRGALPKVPRRFPQVEFFVGDTADPVAYEVKLENVLVTSYSISGARGGNVPMESYTLNFTKITYK